MLRLLSWCGLVILAGLLASPSPTVEARQLPPPISAWRSLGPTNIGGPVTGIATLPGNSQRLVISLLGGGILRTEDAGATWTAVDGIPDFTIARMVGDPNMPTTLYAATGSGRLHSAGVGVLKSTDFGVTWNVLPNSPRVPPTEMAILPDGALVLWGGPVYRSTDGGASWVNTGENTTFPLTVYSRTSPSVGYRFQPTALSRTENGGLSYTHRFVPEAGTPAIESALWIDPTDSATVVAGARDLVITRDAGTTFTAISQWHTAPLAAGVHHRVIVSDGGFNGASNRRVWVGNDYGLFRTDDIYAASPSSGWTFMLGGLATASLEAVAGSPDAVMAVTSNKEVLRLAAGNTTATRGYLLSRFEPAHWIARGLLNIGRNLAIDPGDWNTVYAIGGPLMRSLNGGATFTSINPPQHPGAESLTPLLLDRRASGALGHVSPSQSNAVFTTGNAMSPSPTWVTGGCCLNTVSATDAHQVNGPAGPVVVTGYGGTMRTPQLGNLPFVALAQPPDGPLFHRITSAGANGEVIYGALTGASWRSDNAGQSWVRLADLPSVIQFLTTHPRNPAWVYAATTHGLYRSTDGGATWIFDFPSRVPVTSLAWERGTLVAATRGRGVWAVDVTGTPLVSIDAPVAGQEVPGRFTVTGFAIDTADGTGTGVAGVHVYAYPASGGAPIYLGAAGYGFARNDIGSAYGARFTNSGYSLTAQHLAPGAYTLIAYAHSTFNGQFAPVTRPITIRSGVQLQVENPAGGATVRPPFLISGWAIDEGAAPGTTGIDAVHVWAYPAAGGPPQFVGSALLGVARPDVGALYGSQFESSGFTMPGTGLGPGAYTLAVFAHSTLSGTFTARTISVTVRDTVDVTIDAPTANATVGNNGRVVGWALDTAAVSGTGISAVHVWAYPAAGGSPVFVGTATMGGSRPDVGTAYGPQFNNAGFELSLSSLPAGVWDLAVFAYRDTTASFAPARMVRVTR